MNISACIITNNNPSVIKAIESVYSSVSEIILVNTNGSLDYDLLMSLLRLDKDLKIKYEYFNWTNNFSEARNYSISKAKGDYILIIDSDEVMTAEIKYIDGKYDIYLLQIFNNDLPYWNARVFKNNGKILYKYACHESIEHHITEDNMALIEDCNIVHSGCLHEVGSKELNDKIDRNEKIMLTDLENPVRNYHLGLYSEYKKDYPKAIEYFLNVLNDNVNNEHKANACNYAFRCFKALGRVEVDLLNQSLKYIPLQKFARLEIINCLIGKMKKENDKKSKELAINGLQELNNFDSQLINDINLNPNWINNKIKEIQQWQLQ